MLVSFLTSAVGMAAIGGYVYVGLMIARASLKAGNTRGRVAWDAFTWPVMGWAAIEKLYNV